MPIEFIIQKLHIISKMLLKVHFKVVKSPLPPTKKSQTESPLKMMKNYFYFTLKARFVLKIQF